MIREKRLEWDKEEFEELHNLIKLNDSLSHYEFLRIRNFKLELSSRANEKDIQKITKSAFESVEKDNIIEAIKKLKELDGVGIAIASTILAIKDPDKYCIIDRKVLTNLGKKEWLKSYLSNPKIYKEYLALMVDNAKKEGKKLRDYERELYEKKTNKEL